MAQEIIHIFVVVNVFNFVSLCVAAVESHGQAFIQTDNELRYMVDGHIDGVPPHVIPGYNIQDMSIQDGTARSSPIRFAPPMLDFHEQAVGMPHMEQVTVHNPDTQNSLHLLSISGSTLHFHCSFFQDKMVPPGGNTTFDVVFLARQVGNVENTLYIHTSQGSFKYQVFGVGVPNPYRIRPFIGAKVPLNSSFNPLIRIHNPHSSTLQVVEMYSSGGDLHLELPTGEKEAPRNLWEIPPFETKPVMRASFIARIENNHTAFIRIKTNREKTDEVLIVPVEVEVTSSPGIYSPLEVLDFGILRTLDGPKTLRLNLLNSGSKPVHVTSISVSPPNDAISIEFRPVKLQPDLLQTTPVALISFTASKAIHHRLFSGKIIVKSKSGSFKISIPYQANVMHGSLVYERNKTEFFTGQSPARNVTREIPFTNTFNFTIVIYNASITPDAASFFTIEKLVSPVEMRPQHTVTPFKIKFHPGAANLHLTTELHLRTNASTFNIPIVVYNGKLKVVHHRPEIFKGQLDFGTMGVEERRNMTFTLRNDNPVDIVIREFGANMERTQVELLGVERGNGTTLTRIHNTSTIDTNPLILKPYHFAVFSVNLAAPNWEGTFAAEVIIVTQFENLYIPITLRTAEGSLNASPEKLIFEKCFSSKICSQELKIYSSFDQYMEVRDITFQPRDSRFYYVPPQDLVDKPVLLDPHKQTNIGQIRFDSRLECKDDCYLGLPTYIPAGHQWLLGATLDKEVADTDQYLYTRFRQKWENIGLQQLNTINVTIQLDTNQVRGFLFPAQAHLHWPSITRKFKVRFPLTQIGNLSMADFVVENPADAPMLMQLLPLSLYPNPQTIVDLLSPRLSSDLSDYIEMDDLEVFRLQDLEIFSTNPNNPVPGLRKSVENTLGVKPHRNTIAMLVGPGSKVRVRVGFQPKDDLSRTSLIVIRNNLTIIDALVVQGQGGRGEMRFSNRKAGSSSPLQFEMTADKHLKACDKKKQSKASVPNFTVKRTFTARNTGQLPFYVHGFSINDATCEGYGFKVLECEGFELMPNASRKVDLAFTPDFTMSRMRRTLSVFTSLGPAINYTLQATIPAHMLTKCAAALPRPPWEPILYYSTICIMGFLLFCILVASYFEADRIFTADIMRRRSKSAMPQTFDRNRVFDLKAISGIKAIDSSRTVTQKSAVPTNNNTPSTPPVQQQAPLTNGHVENHKKKDTKKGFSLFGIFKRLFSRQKSHEKPTNQPSTEHQNSHEKDNKLPVSVPSPTVTSNVGKCEKQPSVHENNSVIEKTPLVNVKLSNKKAKAAKQRHHQPDLISDLVLTRSGGNRDATTSATTRPSKVAELDNSNKTTTTLDKDSKLHHSFTDPILFKASNPRKLERHLLGGLEPIEPSEVTIVTEDLDLDSGKNAKRFVKQKKGKLAVKQEMAERRLREKLRRHELMLENDKDETSSTTTDSSSAEADDKMSSARESTPEPQLNKKRPKSKKDKKTKAGDRDEEDGNEEEFVITSRSKAHKKIKVDPKNAYGGDIHCPSSLELPYKTKLEADKENSEMNADFLITSTLSNDKIKKMKSAGGHMKKGEVRVPRVMGEAAGSSQSSDRSTESPPPLWDMPTYRADGDLSELSSQTEMFASRHGKSAGGRGTSPDLLSSSSRSSSYSSVVSNGSNVTSSEPVNSRNKYFKVDNNKKATTAGYGAAGAAGNEKIPGAIGSKNMPKPALANMNALRTKNPWTPPSGPATPDGNLSPTGFGLHPIQESAGVATLTEDEMLQNYASSASNAFSISDGMGQLPLAGAGSNAYDMQPVTIMQRLQAERRKRFLEYQQKLMNGEEWPGFNMPLQHESLWDSNVSSEPWTMLTAPCSQPRMGSSSGFWDSATLGASTGSATPGTWTQPTSIWSTDSANGADMGLDPGASGNNSPVDNQGPPPQQQGGGAVGAFDPFNVLGNIWRPTSAGSGWGFVPKPDDDKN